MMTVAKANKGKEMLSVLVQKQLNQALRELADRDRRSLSNLVTFVLANHVEQQKGKKR